MTTFIVGITQKSTCGAIVTFTKTNDYKAANAVASWIAYSDEN
jgi:hypothetical protein